MATYYYRGYRIKPKRDFSGKGHFIKGKFVNKGWVVTNQFDTNVMPGACWFQTLSEARHGIDVLIKSKGDAFKFWEIMQPFNYRRGQQAPDHVKGCSSIVTRGLHWATIGEDGTVKRVGHDGKPPSVWA